MRASVKLAISVSLAGCDTAFRVRGVASDPPGCTVTIINESTGKEYTSFRVKGRFTETIVVGGVFLTNFTAAVSCDGRHVKSIKNIAPTIENFDTPVELGIFAP